MTMQTPQPQGAAPRGRTFVPNLVVSVLFGLAAGAVGTLLAVVYWIPQPEPAAVVALPREAVRPRETQERAASVDAAVRAAVVIHEDLGTGAAPYLPASAVGAATVLTSDGWLVTHESVVEPKAKRADGVAAIVANRAHAAADPIIDPYTGIAFIKIDVANLPVTAFGRAEDLAAGDNAYTFDAAGGLRVLEVIGVVTAPPDSADDLIRSSERLQRHLRLAPEDAVLPGAMVLNAKGEVVAVIAEAGSLGLLAVPAETFTLQIGTVLKDEAFSRPVLGVRYADLSEAVAVNGDRPRRGALLAPSPDGRAAAVARRSAAEAAGLRGGDVIVSVDGEEVSAKRPLSELIAEYAPGSAVALGVERGGELQPVNVTLGPAPSAP
jgi:S1-C subfamily serine protease